MEESFKVYCIRGLIKSIEIGCTLLIPGCSLFPNWLAANAAENRLEHFVRDQCKENPDICYGYEEGPDALIKKFLENGKNVLGAHTFFSPILPFLFVFALVLTRVLFTFRTCSNNSRIFSETKSRCSRLFAIAERLSTHESFIFFAMSMSASFVTAFLYGMAVSSVSPFCSKNGEECSTDGFVEGVLPDSIRRFSDAIDDSVGVVYRSLSLPLIGAAHLLFALTLCVMFCGCKIGNHLRTKSHNERPSLDNAFNQL